VTAFDPTPRTTVRRRRDRACYDRDLVFGILDEGFICHAACTVDGTVWMIPTIYGRDGDRLLLHGAAANHVLKAAASGAELTVTVTLVDGLVLARSTFHHSINYRSVVIFGYATGIEDADEKAAALSVVVEHLLPGRTGDARPPNPTELASSRVVSLPIDDDEDMDRPVWAGVLPLRPAAGAPQADGAGAAVPAYLRQPRRWSNG